MSRRIIIIDDDYGMPYNSQTFTAHRDPCEHCNNNPKNNPLASGVCSCVLPYLNQVVY